MNLKKIFLISLLLLVLTIGAVSASEDLNESISSDDSWDLSVSDDNSLNVDDDDEGDDGGDDEDYTEVNIDIPEIVEIGSGDVIEIELPDDAKGSVSIFVDNVSFKSDQVNGEESNLETYSLDDLSCGMHLVNVTFISSKYGTISQQEWVNVTYNITITIDQDPYILGKDDNLVYVSAPSDILMDINVTIDNKEYKLTKNTNSQGYINISSFEGGSYLIVASFKGNQDYSPYSTNETINIASAIAIPDYSIAYKSDAYVTLKLPNDERGNLILVIDGQLIENATLVNGEAKIKFPTNKVGEFRYNVTYEGDLDIDDIEDEYIRIYPKVNVPTQMTVGEDKYITFDINSDAGGYFLIEADFEEYGIASPSEKVSLAYLEDGEVDILITYYGDNEFVYDDYYFSIYVKSVPVKFVGAKNIKMLYSDGTTYSLAIYGTNGRLLEEDEYVDIIIGNKWFDATTNSLGIVNFKIPDSVLPGKYTITVIYDDIYTVKTKLEVKQILKLKKVKVKKSAKKLVLTANLKKVNNKFLKGKVIVFKFNGKKYSAKTNAKGKAKVTIKSNVLKKLKAGKKITYTATYLKNTVKRTVKVKK